MRNAGLLAGLNPTPAGTPEPETLTTDPFNRLVDLSGQYVYVVNHTTCSNTRIDPTMCSAGNATHILEVDSDGTPTENVHIS